MSRRIRGAGTKPERALAEHLERIEDAAAAVVHAAAVLRYEPHPTGVVVPIEDWAELQKALREWKAATVPAEAVELGRGKRPSW